MLLPKVLYFGPKQGPGIFQSFVDSVFNRIVGDEDEEFLSVFVDDCNISTPKVDNETDDECWTRHIRHLEIFLEQARSRKIQFKLEKAKFGWPRIPMLGMVVGRGTRTIQPGKA